MTNQFLLPLLIVAQEAAQTVTEATAEVDRLNPWELILKADLVVQGVMILLLLASVISWTIIFWKWIGLSNAANENQKFADSFWSAGSLDGAIRASKSHPNSALTRIFETGLHEFNLVTQLEMQRPETIELLESNVARSLDKAVKIEVESFQRYNSFLANVASAAPFIGLFGTVWGIMNAFIGIGAEGSSNLAVVAPGIAEALIATAMGLFAAIPAVLFYNFFVGHIKSLSNSMAHFSTDFLNTAKRSI